MNFDEKYDLLVEEKLYPVDILRKYADKEDVYISFTQNLINDQATLNSFEVLKKQHWNGLKLGINPKSNYDTPIGIYCYPLKEMWHDIEKNIIPFAGEQPNIFIFGPNAGARIAKNSTYTHANFMSDYEKLEAIAQSQSSSAVFSGILARIDARYTRSSLQAFWSLTREYVEIQINLEDVKGKHSVVWAKLLNRFYDAIIDDTGLGLIHSNEPQQGVFFSTSSIQIYDVIRRFKVSTGSWQAPNVEIFKGYKLLNDLKNLIKNKSSFDEVHQKLIELYDVDNKHNNSVLLRISRLDNISILKFILININKFKSQDDLDILNIIFTGFINPVLNKSSDKRKDLLREYKSNVLEYIVNHPRSLSDKYGLIDCVISSLDFETRVELFSSLLRHNVEPQYVGIKRIFSHLTDSNYYIDKVIDLDIPYKIFKAITQYSPNDIYTYYYSLFGAFSNNLKKLFPPDFILRFFELAKNQLQKDNVASWMSIIHAITQLIKCEDIVGTTTQRMNIGKDVMQYLLSYAKYMWTHQDMDTMTNKDFEYIMNYYAQYIDYPIFNKFIEEMTDIKGKDDSHPFLK